MEFDTQTQQYFFWGGVLYSLYNNNVLSVVAKKQIPKHKMHCSKGGSCTKIRKQLDKLFVLDMDAWTCVYGWNISQEFDNVKKM